MYACKRKGGGKRKGDPSALPTRMIDNRPAVAPSSAVMCQRATFPRCPVSRASTTMPSSRRRAQQAQHRRALARVQRVQPRPPLHTARGAHCQARPHPHPRTCARRHGQPPSSFTTARWVARTRTCTVVFESAEARMSPSPRSLPFPFISQEVEEDDES